MRSLRFVRRLVWLVPVVVAVVAVSAAHGTDGVSRMIDRITDQLTPIDKRAHVPQARPTPVDAGRFAASSCIAYPPTRGDRHQTVFLDAGHGGLDPGSVGTTSSGQTIDEATETLPVELDAMRLLRAQGYRVVVSRTANASVAKLTSADIDGDQLTDAGVHADVAARAICANEAHASVLIGIYFDAGAPYNAGSVTGYDADRPFAKANLRLATLVQNDVLHAMNARGWQIPSEGVQLDSGLGSAHSSAAVSYGHLLELGPAEAGWFSTPSKMPGAVIEPLFITDPFEGTIAASSRGQQVIAQGLTEAVEQYFGAAQKARGARLFDKRRTI